MLNTDVVTDTCYIPLLCWKLLPRGLRPQGGNGTPSSTLPTPIAVAATPQNLAVTSTEGFYDHIYLLVSVMFSEIQHFSFVTYSFNI